MKQLPLNRTIQILCGFGIIGMGKNLKFTGFKSLIPMLDNPLANLLVLFIKRVAFFFLLLR